MDVDKLVKPLILKDLRAQLRARGCNPAGGADELRMRLKEDMATSGNYSINVGGVDAPPPALAGASTEDMHSGSLQNNYARPSGMQNVGNFITDKPSSRVLAPPGGGSQIMFGDHMDPHTQRAPPPAAAPHAQGPPLNAPWGTNYSAPPAPQQQQAPRAGQQPSQAPFAMDPSMAFGGNAGSGDSGSQINNYARPSGQQNVGNHITNRPSSRVLAPPGGKSQISFG